MQEQYIFFGAMDPHGRDCPSDEERRWRIDRGNPKCPFSRFVGNDKAVRKLQVAAYKALGHPGHLMRDLSFAIFGPASAGKTTLARLYAETVELPFVEVSPKQVKTLDDLFDLISSVLSSCGLPLIDEGNKRYRLPPCVIFIDEVHALVDSVVQGLLKATEFNDAVMATERGVVLRTYSATWLIATTDEGKLFDAFRTRFSPVHLNYLNKSEIASVVKLAHPDLDLATCELVAHYNSRVPRKALEFARYMKMVREMELTKSWEDIAKQVAHDEGIDEFGMHNLHLKVIRALANGSISQKRMPTVVGRKEEEVERFVMPWLMTETEDQPALVTMTSRGYALTDAGMEEIAKRDIPYKGMSVIG